MFIKETLKNLVVFGPTIAILLILIFKKDPAPVYPITTKKVIEKNIIEKEGAIKEFETRVVQDKKIVSEINDQISMLRLELNKFKNQRDTFQIVQIQDTLIYALSLENSHLHTIVNNQDSIITAQRYIINSKDTIIAIGNHTLKRVKRQRNISLLINAIQTGVIIFK